MGFQLFYAPLKGHPNLMSAAPVTAAKPGANHQAGTDVYDRADADTSSTCRSPRINVSGIILIVSFSVLSDAA